MITTTHPSARSALAMICGASVDRGAALPRVAGWQPFDIGASWTGSEAVTWVASQRPAANGIRPSGFRFSAYSWVPGSQAWAVVPSRPDYAYFPYGTAAAVGGRLLFLGGTGCPPGASCPVQDFFDGSWFDPGSGTWTGLARCPVPDLTTTELRRNHQYARLTWRAAAGGRTPSGSRRRS